MPFPYLLMIGAFPVVQLPVAEQPTEMQVICAVTDSSELKIEEDTRIYRALDQQIPQGFELRDVPLRKAVTQLTHHGRISVVAFDSAKIKVAGVDSTKRVNLIFWDVTLRDALKALLEPHGLDFTVHDGRLQVSTIDRVTQITSLRTYDVSDLLEDGDIEELVIAIREQLSDSDSSCRISGYRNLLLVTGNRHMQERVQRTLKVLTKGLTDTTVRRGEGQPVSTYAPANRPD